MESFSSLPEFRVGELWYPAWSCAGSQGWLPALSTLQSKMAFIELQFLHLRAGVEEGAEENSSTPIDGHGIQWVQLLNTGSMWVLIPSRHETFPIDTVSAPSACQLPMEAQRRLLSQPE